VGKRQQVLQDENLQRAYGGKVMFFSEADDN
jgi:manganese/iron transport system ATP-binding protein